MVAEKSAKLRYKEILNPATNEILGLHQQGLNCTEIASLYGVPSDAVWRFLTKNGAKFTWRTYKLNENYFDEIDTEDKAYFLGFLYADGCNYRARHVHNIQIGLQEKDVCMLEAFKEYLGYEGPISHYSAKDSNAKWHRVTSLTISSKHMSDRLIELGMVPRKSMVLTYPDFLPKSLQHHFIRGYFDGDGCISCHTPTGRAKADYIISFASTPMFCESLASIFRDCIGVSSFLYTPKKAKCVSLSVNGNKQVGKLAEYLYDGATIYLKRKYDKYLQLVEQQKMPRTKRGTSRSVQTA